MKSDARMDLRVCVVGTGALGSALLDQLRAHHFRSVLLVDPDLVEARNLHMSALLRRANTLQIDRASEGETWSLNKAEMLAAAARVLDSLPWQSEACEIADLGWEVLRGVDVICCCTDSVLSRVETCWAARALEVPMLDGAVFGYGLPEGRVTEFPAARSAACTLCGLTEERRAAVLGDAVSTSLGCRVPESVPAMTGTLATLDAVADCMLRHILEWPGDTFRNASADACTTRLSQVAEGEWKAETIRLSASATCPWHDPPLGALEPLPWECPIERAIQGGNYDVALNWPICTEAVCDACGERTVPMQRVARVRRAPCPVCRERRQQPLRAVHRIRNGEPSRSLSPRQLGMPSQHLYWLHKTAPEPLWAEDVV